MVSVAPPPVSAVDGFLRTPVSKSSNMSMGMFGVTVEVCVTVGEKYGVFVLVIECVGVIVGVKYGVFVAVLVRVGEFVIVPAGVLVGLAVGVRVAVGKFPVNWTLST